MVLFCFIFGMCLGAFLMAPMSYLGTKVRGNMQKQDNARIQKAKPSIKVVQTESIVSESVQSEITEEDTQSE